MHPNFEDQYGGYVLLVGESEVIPGYQTDPYELYWKARTVVPIIMCSTVIIPMPILAMAQWSPT